MSLFGNRGGGKRSLKMLPSGAEGIALGIAGAMQWVRLRDSSNVEGSYSTMAHAPAQHAAARALETG